jgi:hypothetical protein
MGNDVIVFGTPEHRENSSRFYFLIIKPRELIWRGRREKAQCTGIVVWKQENI